VKLTLLARQKEKMHWKSTRNVFTGSELVLGSFPKFVGKVSTPSDPYYLSLV
jgi:hypothetical protein